MISADEILERMRCPQCDRYREKPPGVRVCYSCALNNLASHAMAVSPEDTLAGIHEGEQMAGLFSSIADGIESENEERLARVRARLPR